MKLRVRNPEKWDAETLEQVAKLNASLEANPLGGYAPYEHQIAYHSAKTKIRALIAGNRSGKTHCSIADDLIQCIDEDWVPAHLKEYKRWQPPFKMWLCCPKFAQLDETVLPKLRALCPRSQLLGGSFEKAYDKQNRVLRFSNESRIGFKTYEQDRDAYAGADLHRVHWDEEPEGEHGWAIRQEARARLLDHGGEEVLSMTPVLGYSWVFDEIYEKRHEGGVTVVNADMDDNLSLNQEAKREFLAALTDEERKARKEGKFVHFGGIFYDEFNDSHLVDQSSRDHLKGQDVVVGIDPGFRRSGIVWVAFDNDNAAMVFDEFYPTELVVKPIADEIKRRNEFWGLDDPQYVIDPSARNRATINAEGVEGEFAREGIFCQHGQNDRATGILEVKARLQHNQLTVSKTCQHIIKEFPRYRRDPNSNDEWAAIKVDDHLLDALRYACMLRVWHQPSVREPKRTAYQQGSDYQPPYGTETFPTEPPPLGVLS